MAEQCETCGRFTRHTHAVSSPAPGEAPVALCCSCARRHGRCPHEVKQ